MIAEEGTHGNREYSSKESQEESMEWSRFMLERGF